MPVDLVGAIGETQRALAGVDLGQRRPLRDAGGAVDLDRVVDDLTHPDRHHGLDGGDPDTSLGVAELVHGLGRGEHHAAHRFDLDAVLGHHLHVLAELGDGLAERLAGETALDQQVQRSLGRTDRAHAVVDSARAEAQLGDLEATTLTEEHVRRGNTAVGEPEVHVPVRGVVVTEDVHRPHDLDAGRVLGYQDLALLLVRRTVRVGLQHDDEDLAPRVAGARGVVLLTVDDPLVAVKHGATGDLLGIGGCDVRLGHDVRRADLTVEKRLEPLLLLLGGANPLEHLHVARVGRRAVHALGGDRVLAELGRDVGVVEVAEALAGLGVGKEEVPQTGLFGLGLDGFEQLELAVAIAPTLGSAFTQPEELLGVRLDLFGDELLHRLEQRLGLVGHA